MSLLLNKIDIFPSTTISTTIYNKRIIYVQYFIFSRKFPSVAYTQYCKYAPARMSPISFFFFHFRRQKMCAHLFLHVIVMLMLQIGKAVFGAIGKAVFKAHCNEILQPTLALTLSNWWWKIARIKPFDWLQMKLNCCFDKKKKVTAFDFIWPRRTLVNLNLTKFSQKTWDYLNISLFIHFICWN